MANLAGKSSVRLACPLCGGEALPHYPQVVDALGSEVFSILRCANCHSGLTHPVPEDLKRFYGPAYHGQRHGSTAGFCARRRMRILAQLFGKTGAGRLLDVGCGDGTFLLAAQARGWKVAGTEMNPELARANGLTVHSSFDQLPADARFDCITFWHVLEHLIDPRAAIAAATERLSPSGRLVVAVPNSEGWQASLFGKHWLHLDVPRHVTHFTERGLLHVLTAAGFKSERRWHQELEYDLMGWAQSALNAATPAPNVFFHWLAGKPRSASRSLEAANIVAGTVLTVLAVPLVLVSTALKRGGTIIVAAKRG